jgi:hypothetical protein
MLVVGAFLAMALGCKSKGPEQPAPTPRPTAAQPGGAAKPTPAPAATPAAPQGAAVIPEPKAIGVSDVAVTVRINSLNLLLPKIQAIVSQFAPGITPEAIKAIVGSPVGDPGLAGLDPASPILLAVFDFRGGESPAVAAMIPVTSDQYKTMFQARQLSVYQKEGSKTLLVAQDERAAVAGRQAFDQLEALRTQPMSSDISVYGNIEMLVTNHAAQITSAMAQNVQNMKQMQQMTGFPSAIIYLSAASNRNNVAMLKEIKDATLDISLSKDAVDLGATIRAKPGTDMAKMLSPRTTPDPSLLGYLPNTGAIVGLAGADPENQAKKISDMADLFLAEIPQTELGPIKKAELKDWLVRSTKLSRGAAFDFLTAGSSDVINFTEISEATDPKQVEAMLQSLSKDLENTGITAALKSAGVGLNVQYTPNARTHSGVAIAKMVIDLTLPQMPPNTPPPAQALLSKITHLEAEIATVDSNVILDVGSKRMDAIIDAMKAKKPLATAALASQAFPKGGYLYLDIYPDRAARWVIQLIESIMGPGFAAMGPRVEQIVAQFKTLQTKPIAMYCAAANGAWQGKFSIPMEPIAKIRQILMAPPVAPPPPPPVAP